MLVRSLDGGKIPWRRKWQPTQVFLPGESHEQKSLVGYSPWGHKELGQTELNEHTHKLALTQLGNILDFSLKHWNGMGIIWGLNQLTFFNVHFLIQCSGPIGEPSWLFTLLCDNMQDINDHGRMRADLMTLTQWKSSSTKTSQRIQSLSTYDGC